MTVPRRERVPTMADRVTTSVAYIIFAAAVLVVLMLVVAALAAVYKLLVWIIAW